MAVSWSKCAFPPECQPWQPPCAMRPTAAIMAADGGSTRSPHSCTSLEVACSENRACAIGLRSFSGRLQVPQHEKWGSRIGCQNSTFSRGPKSTESDEVRVLDHRGVIKGRSRGTIVLTTHLSGVVLRRSPAAPSGVSLGYKTSKVTNTGGQQC